MDGEALEKNTFEPFFEEIESRLKGKKVALFGSYGWGNGEWMRDWEDRIGHTGARLFDEGLMIKEFPDDAGRHACVRFFEPDGIGWHERIRCSHSHILSARFGLFLSGYR